MHQTSQNLLQRKAEIQPQIPALTGLRFLAAFFILFAHATDWLMQFQNSEIRQYFRFVAMYGMPLFFVLSGFVIHYNYRKLFNSKPLTQATFQFMAARFARLFPLYFFFLLVSIFADNFIRAMYHDPEAIVTTLFINIIGTQAWFYLIFNGQLIINILYPLSWSISTEVFFYVAYVPLVFLILKLSDIRVASITSLVYSVSVMLIFVLSRYHLIDVLSFAKQNVRGYIDLNQAFQHSFYRWLFYFSPYARVFEFIMGCLAAHTFVLASARPISAREFRLGTAALIAAFAVLVVAGLLYTDALILQPINPYVRHLGLNFLCAPAIAVILFCVSRYETPFSRVMSSRTLVALGDMSYSIYLAHWWTVRVFLHPAPPFSTMWAIEAASRVIVAITLTLVVAFATYHLIEMPARVWLRRRLGKWIASLYRNRTTHVKSSAAIAGVTPLEKAK